MIQPGTRVEIEDAERDPSNFAQATVVAAESDFIKGDGYVVRYDNGCEVWVDDWHVRKLEPSGR